MSAVSGMIRTMAAVPRVHLANPKKNAEEIAALLHIADENGVQLCVFPQLCLTGYTCGDLFLQPALLRGAQEALVSLSQLETKTAFVVGLPLMIGPRLYNCAAVVCSGNVTIVPKKHVPAEGGFCEHRWFACGDTACDTAFIPGLGDVFVAEAGHTVFDCGSFTFGVEIGEDALAPHAPSADLSMRGAQIIANPAAVNELMGSHSARHAGLCQHSARCLCGYIYAGAGYGESTTDMVFSGYAGVYEAGDLLARNERFARSASYAIADIDAERIAYKRCARPSFFGSASPEASVLLPLPQIDADTFLRPLSRLPFVPQGPDQEETLRDALNIQALGLIRRMEHIRSQKLVLGVSGGLDSTLALLSAAYAYDLAGWDKKGIVGITMPGFGTGSRTRGNADLLMERIGCTTLTIPIGPAVTQHFADIGHSLDARDVCYENSQARERTQIVMDYANKIGALALGTGDLSEVALGWCTYNGDHMSMYNMNGSVPKTLMRPMVAYAAKILGGDLMPVAQDILDTPVSPELLPGKNGEIAQKTEDTLGAYELHDFFLYHMMDAGASPKKLFAMACQTFDGEYSRSAILAALRTFIRRFFTQQFKRSAMPDGPQVTPVSLSPRGGWHMPSDALMQLWLEEAEALNA